MTAMVTPPRRMDCGKWRIAGKVYRTRVLALRGADMADSETPEPAGPMRMFQRRPPTDRIKVLVPPWVRNLGCVPGKLSGDSNGELRETDGAMKRWSTPTPPGKWGVGERGNDFVMLVGEPRASAGAFTTTVEFTI